MSTYERLVNTQKFFSPYLTQEDMSRFGRNYILVGQYVELVLPQHHVRVIGVTDNYDSYNTENDLFVFESAFVNKKLSHLANKKVSQL